MYIDVADVIILVLDLDATVTLINKKGCEVTGYSKEEIIGRNWVDLVIPERIQKNVEAVFKELVIGNAQISERFENPIIDKNGEERIISWHNVLIRDDGGKIINVLSSGEDITEHKKVEEDLEAKRNELKVQNQLTSNFLSILEVTASSLNFSESLNQLLPYTIKLFDSPACLTFVVNRKDEDIQPHIQWGLPQELMPYFLASTPNYPEIAAQPVIMNQESQVINDLVKRLPECIFDLRELFEKLGAQALLMMPISFRNQVIFIMLFPKQSAFSQKDKEIADRLCRHLESSYIAGKYADDLLHETLDLTQQVELVGAISGIDQAILQSSSKKEITYSVLRLLKKAISYNLIEVLDYDADAGKLRLIAAREEGKILHPETETFETSEIVAWSNISLGIPTYYANLRREKRVKEYEQRFMAKGLKSLLVIPLISKTTTLGLIAIAHNMPAAYSAQQLEAAKKLSDRLAVALSNMGLIDQLREMMVGTINSLVTALDAKSPWTQGHSDRVSTLAVKIGEILGLSYHDLYELKLAALFHDVGKIGTYDKILDKGAQLSDEEYKLIRRHPTKTGEILAAIPRLKNVARIAEHHHEQWDGRGYPDGLEGDAIPYMSRIITCADALDAMTSARSYRQALSFEQAIKEFSEMSGKQFDPAIAKVFIEYLQNEIESRKNPRKAA